MEETSFDDMFDGPAVRNALRRSAAYAAGPPHVAPSGVNQMARHVAYAPQGLGTTVGPDMDMRALMFVRAPVPPQFSNGAAGRMAQGWNDMSAM